MTSQPDARPSAPDPLQPLKRRGLLAAGVALVAGLVAKLTEQPVSAGTDGDVVLGASTRRRFRQLMQQPHHERHRDGAERHRH